MSEPRPLGPVAGSDSDAALGQPAGEENYKLPVDEDNFERRYAAALTFYGWDADRTELKEAIRLHLLEGRHIVFSAPCGYGKQGAWAIVAHMTKRAVLVLHPQKSIGIAGVYDAEKLGLRAFRMDGDTDHAEDERKLRQLDVAGEQPYDVIFCTMDQLVQASVQKKNLIVAMLGRGRFNTVNVDEFGALRIEAMAYRDSLLSFPRVAQAMSKAHPGVGLFFTDATVDGVTRSWAIGCCIAQGQTPPAVWKLSPNSFKNNPFFALKVHFVERAPVAALAYVEDVIKNLLGEDDCSERRPSSSISKSTPCSTTFMKSARPTPASTTRSTPSSGAAWLC